MTNKKSQLEKAHHDWNDAPNISNSFDPTELVMWRIELVIRKIEKMKSWREVEIVPAGAEEIKSCDI